MNPTQSEPHPISLGAQASAERAIFASAANSLHVDDFYEKLDFCHIIRCDNRLEADAPTLPLAELLLGKNADRAPQRIGRHRHDHAAAGAPAGRYGRGHA